MIAKKNLEKVIITDKRAPFKKIRWDGEIAKIPGFSARLSALITVIQVFDNISFFQLSDSKKTLKKIRQEKN
jgi:hypothetical protein